ncbi:hypothetical protein [Yoonia sp.]|uniref:hypothetical protein n=1 Tax=Yoonia sp. TaxID=2212373 RepID=UPI002FDACD9B
MTRPNDDFLEDLFARAQGDRATPQDDLVARVLADADAVQAGLATQTARPAPPGLWSRMLVALGGWPAVSGLAAATVAGVWIGVAPPAPVADVTADILGTTVAVPLVPYDLGLSAGEFADG